MKIEHLLVEHFLGIERAELALGPGLNVLYGPNDLGKSSLASALRVALLLPTSSSLKQHFQPWQGGEPKVALTMQDDRGVRWKISKHLGGRGATKLEKSTDGVRFAQEAKDRDADERLRQLLGWGLGDGRGKMPSAFVTHALLAEQDELRKIFEASIDDDKEESGKQRLERALGALAQSPEHKRALEVAQQQVAIAFTDKGKLKRGRSSPFARHQDQIEGLYAQKVQLEEKQQETQHARARLRELDARHGQAFAQLEAARVALRTAEQRFAAGARRQELEKKLRECNAKLTKIGQLAAQLEAKQAEADRCEARLRQAVLDVERGQMEQQAADNAAAELQQQLNALTSGNGDLDRALARHQEQEKRATELVNEVQSQARAAEEALARARTLSRELSERQVSRQRAAQRLADAAQALELATGAERVAEAVLEQAKQQLRDATSEDRARSRELARQQLENRRLQLDAQRAELVRISAQLAEVKLTRARVQTAQLAQVRSLRELAEASEAAETARREISELEGALLQVRCLSRAAQLREVRAELNREEAESAASARDLQTALRLRAEAKALRALWGEELPSAERLEALRALKHQLEVAAARLTAVAVTIKPRRMLEAVVTRDGHQLSQRLFSSQTTLSADGELTIAIEDLVELEISGAAGEDKAALQVLKGRWTQEAESVLVAAGCTAFDELSVRCAQRDRSLAQANEHERAAVGLEQLAQRRPMGDLEGLRHRHAVLAEELGDEAAVLIGQLERLGTGAAIELERRSELASKQLIAARERQAQRAAELARLETQREHDAQGLAQANAQLTSQLAQLADSPETVETRLIAERQSNEDHLRALEAQQREQSGDVSQEEASARAAVAQREGELAAVQLRRRAAEAEERDARDEVIATKTALESTRCEALAHDRAGCWGTSLAELDALTQRPVVLLPIEAWQRAALAAAEQRDVAVEQLTRLQLQLEELRQQRAAAISQGGERVRDAQRRSAEAHQQQKAMLELEKLGREQLASCREELVELRTANAGSDGEQAERDVAALHVAVAALPAVSPISEEELERARHQLVQSESQLRGVEGEQMHAKGALEQVGGSAIDDELRAVQEAIDLEQENEHQLQICYEGWKLLVEALSEAEANTTRHLGSMLGPAVSRRFRELTGSRYGNLELSAQLCTEAIHVAGERREVSAISSGTQDQLATLLRLCVAEQLRSAIVLDDPLCQSDQERMAWFDRVIRASAPQVQILFITCHPDKILLDFERPRDGELFRDSESGLLRAVDLNRIIRRVTALPQEQTASFSSSPRMLALD